MDGRYSHAGVQKDVNVSPLPTAGAESDRYRFVDSPDSTLNEGAVHTNRFPGRFRLKRRRLIRPLFDRQRRDVGSIAVGCIRLLFRIVPRREAGSEAPLQVGFVPGRAMRKAVERNRVKRILREVYRVRQHNLVDLFLQRGDTLTMMILFRGKMEEVPECIQKDLPEALSRLERLLSEKGRIS